MTIRFLSCLLLIAYWCSDCFAQDTLKIDPEERTGATVRYFGWDAKLHGNLSNRQKSANWLYGDCPANMMRIPIRPRASTPDGKVDFNAAETKHDNYGPLIDSIKLAQQVNPDIKIFASTKLFGKNTFPDWMTSNQQGKIFSAVVKCPDPKKFAGLITDYFEQLAAEGIKIDFVGLNNEIGGALTPELYYETAKQLEANLEKSTIAEKLKQFQWIGGEEFGVPSSVKYTKVLKNSPASKYVDVVGSHFYPDKQSGSIKSWEALAALGYPTWHTEVHVRRHDSPKENIVAIRDGMCIVFKTNQVGAEGYVWWDGTANEGFLGNHIRRQIVQSMLYGSCIKTEGSYEAKDNEPNKRIAQATRVGDTVWLWCFNPGEAVEEIPVELVSGEIKSAKATAYVGGRKVTPDSIRELNVKTAGSKKLSVQELPEYCVVLVEIQLEDDDQLLPVQIWRQIKPKKKTFKASLSRLSGKTLIFKSSKGKSIKLPVKSLDPGHYPEIKDALKAHGLR